MLTNKLKETLLNQLLLSNNNKKLIERVEYDEYLQNITISLVKRILNGIYVNLTNENRNLLNSEQNLNEVYDNHLQKKLCHKKEKCYLDIPLFINGKKSNIWFIFEKADKVRAFSFQPDVLSNLLYIFGIKYKCRLTEKGIPLSEIKFLFDNQNYLVHEISHLLLDLKTNGKSNNKNNEKYKKHGSYYYNHPSEYNSFYQQLLSELDSKFSDDYKELEDILKLRNYKDLILRLTPLISPESLLFLKHLNPVKQREFVNDLYDYIKYKILNLRESFVLLDDLCDNHTIYWNHKITEQDLDFYLNEIKEVINENNE